MRVLELHDRANEAIATLDVALAETVGGDADGEKVTRPATVRSLPDADYGTPAGCDRALVEIGRRIERLGQLEDVEGISGPRMDALIACRELADAVKRHRTNLGMVDSG